MAFVPALLAGAASEIAAFAGVETLAAGASTAALEATGSALVAGGVRTGVNAAAVFGISETIKKGSGSLYESALDLETRLEQNILDLFKESDNKFNWSPEVLKRIKERQEELLLSAEEEFKRTRTSGTKNIENLVIEQVTEELVNHLQYKGDDPKTISNIVSKIPFPSVLGIYIFPVISERSKFILESMNDPIFARYQAKYSFPMLYKNLTVEIDTTKKTPDTGLPVRRWYYQPEPGKRFLLWDTSYNVKNRKIIPTIYGVYVGKDSRNDASPLRPSNQGNLNQDNISSIDMICQLHDLNYARYGTFSKRADYILLAMISANYEFLNETEKQVSRIATNYFFTIGSFVSKKDQNDEDFTKNVYEESNEPNESIESIESIEFETSNFNKQLFESIQLKERQRIIDQLFKELEPEPD